MTYLPSNLADQQFLNRLRNSSDIAFLSLDEQRNVRILHHFEELPGTILHTDVSQLVCLTGLGGSVQMMAPTTTDLLRPAVTINTPAYTNFKTCTTTEQVIALQASNHANQAITARALIPLPIKLLPVIATLIATEGTSPMNLLPGLIRAFTASDAKNIPDDSKLGKRAVEVLKFLWAADKSNDMNSQLPTITAAFPNHPSADAFFQQCNNKLHPAPTQHQHPPLRPEEERVLRGQEQSSAAIMEAANLFKEDQLRKERAETSKPKTGYDGLFEPLKVMILRASATTTEEPADVPTATMKAIIDSRTAFEATKTLDISLNQSFQSTTLTIPPTMAAKIRQGNLASDKGGVPSGFSILFCFDDEYTDKSEHGDVDAMSLEMSESSTQTLSKATAKTLSNEKAYISFPRNHLYLKEGIDNYYQLCILLFGQNAIFTKAIKSWSRHMKTNLLQYKHLSSTNKNFCLSVAALIDRGWKLFLSSCLNAKEMDEINFQAINFTLPQQSIMMGLFSFVIPPELLQLDPRSNPKPSSSGKRKRDDNPASYMDEPVYNPQQKDTKGIQNWAAFLREQNQHALLRGICSNWHLRGKCKKDCNRRASHTHLVNPAADAFQQLVNKHSK